MDWSMIPYFEKQEFDDPLHAGSGDNISRGVILILVGIRDMARVPIIIHGPVGGAVDMLGEHGHAPNSYHLAKNGCEAVDFHFDCTADDRTQASWVFTSGFTGVGVYYDWHWRGNPLPIGFHGDIRPKHMTQSWKRNGNGYTYFLA